MAGIASGVGWVDVDGVRVAYQVIGEGPPDILALDIWFTNLDLDWTDPFRAAYLRRIAARARLIRFDKGGMGLSDRVPPRPDVAMPTWVNQALGVLDAVGSERTSLLVSGWSGPLGVALAARDPRRFDRVAFATAFARLRGGDGFPEGVDPLVVAAGREIILEAWGSCVMPLVHGQDQSTLSPHQVLVEGRYERGAVAPRDLVSLVDAIVDADMTPQLGAISSETVVVHRSNPLLPVAHAQLIASSISSATLELVDDPSWHFRTGDDELAPDVLRSLEFLLGTHSERQLGTQLVTMVFLDVVSSTPLVSRVGDREWAEILRGFTATLGLELSHHRGRLINRSGDGFFVVLDSPSRALRFAQAIREAAGPGLPIRVGVHTGECQVDGEDLVGLAVHAAARIMGLAGPSEVLVSQVVTEIVDSDEFGFDDMGVHQLRGVPGSWKLHALAPR